MYRPFIYEREDGRRIVLDRAHGYVISRPEGIDAVSTNYSTILGYQRIGTVVESFTVQPRVVTLTGVLCGQNQADRKRELTSTILPGRKGRLYFNGYYLDVYTNETPRFEGRPFGAQFTFMLVAPYPYWIAVEPTVIAVVPANEGGFIFDNDSDVEIPFTYTIKVNSAGTITELAIEDIDRNSFLRFDNRVIPGSEMFIQVGDTLTMEISHESVDFRSDRLGDCTSRLKPTSTFFRLEPGENHLGSVFYGSGSADFDYFISFRTEKAGL